ncbi:sensor histidine kinase [Azonexus hydrophilus]|uniref:sensor histidine kinase n=1 Tax=Azonexus hydrophilus TaxID=418702 RepID=UPI001F05255B|nr:ATP-binding protein [Azonexus hydrophilus]
MKASVPAWLTSTWEANWHSFQYFLFARFLFGALCLLGLVFPGQWNVQLALPPSPTLFTLFILFLLLSGGGLLLARLWQKHFNFQLSLQVVVDIVLINSLMVLAGGIESGFGLILLVSLAAASLVGQGRWVLFYAALATFSVLIMQSQAIVAQGADSGSIVQAGFISAAYFATAILARLLGQRIMANEELARRRGIELADQIHINQRVVERMQDGVLILGHDGRIVRHNPMAARLLGLPEAATHLESCTPPLAAALQNWLAGYSSDSVFISGAGNAELGARFMPTGSSSGEVLVFVEDVERIKEQAKQLKLAALGRLTASIAHEIRNPLSAIGHAAELLHEERRGETFDRLLRIIGDNTLRLNRIVTDVLELGRQKQARVEGISLRPFLVRLAEDAQSVGQWPPDVVRLDVPPSLLLCFDRAHLHQVLWNLIANAVRHSSGKPGAVQVRAAASEASGRVDIAVCDDGPGVSEQMRDQIFEPFFTTHSLGTGLGLFIARELCVANGATLVLRNLAPGMAPGAQFVISGRCDTCL